MTRLLVSVRTAAEAELALAGGADYIDVKEPDRGPLGRADFAVIAEIVARIAGRAPVSAALGELLDWQPGDASQVSAGLDYVKFGLAGCQTRPDWPVRWQQVVEQLPRDVIVVPVCYADWQESGSPEPLEAVEVARNLGCSAVLVDTFDKRGPGLIDLLPFFKIDAFVAAAQAADMKALLAGRLTAGAIQQILPLEPDVVGVRGAVCVGGRDGQLDPHLVRQLSQLLQANARRDRQTSDEL